MQKLLSTFSVFIFGLLLAIYLFPSKAFASDYTNQSKAIITEIRLGGDFIGINGVPAKEYVSLYNQSDEELTLDNFRLEYVKDDFTGNCINSSWGGTPSTVRNLDGILQPGQVATFKYNLSNDITLTDNRSGSIRLVEDASPQTLIHDLVGWGNSSVCHEGLPESFNPLTGESLQRYVDCDTNKPIDTDNNLADFVLSTTKHPPKPGMLAGPTTDGCASTDPGTGGNDEENTPPPDNVPGGQGAGPQTSCDGLIVNELLPNPAGTDTGHEFIELYNPTEDILPLSGCKLQTSANTKIYEFVEGQLQPGQYQAFYNDKTGLTLANSGGGSVYLIDTDDTEIYQVNYASDLDDDVSWSLVDGGWISTFSVTPNKANDLLEIKPCPSGQMRNPGTGRCVNIAAEAAGLSPCPAGKERNPDTNRCRNISSLASILKSCAADQVRNPATGRCKKVSNSSLASCKPGQERNPDTHRCRKSSASSSNSINDVKDVLSTTSQGDHTNWLLASLAAVGALLYAFWEWRNEIIQQIGVLKSKFV